MEYASIGCRIGNGLIAGFAGTAAMTVSQWVEMAIRKRPSSQTPANAVEKVFSIRPVDEAAERRLTQYVHFGYGTAWGLFRGLLDLLGIRGPVATIGHGATVVGVSMVMLPGLELAPPPKEWGAKAIAIDTLHHAVYAGTAGLVYDALGRRSRAAWSANLGLGLWKALTVCMALALGSALPLLMRKRTQEVSLRPKKWPLKVFHAVHEPQPGL